MSGLLTRGDVCAAAAVSPDQLDSWVESGALAPVGTVAGAGHYRGFTVTDAIAAAFGARMRSIGASPVWMRNAVRAVADLGGDGLREAFEAGRTMMLPLFSAPGRAFLMA